MELFFTIIGLLPDLKKLIDQLLKMYADMEESERKAKLKEELAAITQSFKDKDEDALNNSLNV